MHQGVVGVLSDYGVKKAHKIGARRSGRPTAWQQAQYVETGHNTNVLSHNVGYTKLRKAQILTRTVTQTLKYAFITVPSMS